ncbi:MAG: hypothetical protein WCK33_11125 [Phycisphaerae bacterium]|jgi:hypothetical protein
MRKFLRKYNKWVLPLFTILLMLTWATSGTGMGGDPGKRVVATLAGRNIRASEMLKAENEYRALREYLPGMVSMRVGAESGTHWYLLAMQAERAGLVGDKGDGETWEEGLAAEEARYEVMGNPEYRGVAEFLLNNPQMMNQFTQQTGQRMAMLRERARGPLTPDEFGRALSRLRGVTRLIDAFQHAPRISDARLVGKVADLSTRISFDAVEIPADRVKGVAEPTQQTLEAMFEKYKGVKPGTGEYGFGYEEPKRVKIEWMTLSNAAIAAAVKLDPVEVNKHWQQNRGTFKGEFAAERANVETALRSSKVEAAVTEADRVIRARIRSATRNLDSAAGVKRLPDDWASRRPSMEELARTVVAEVSAVRMPQPAVQVKGSSFTPIEEFRSMGELAAAQFRVGTQTGGIVDFLAQTYELSKSNTLGLQAGVPFEQALTDSTGNRYYVTVLDARLESPAEALAGIRDRVLGDARKLAAFEKLKGETAALQVQAITDGLEGVAKAFGTGGGAATDLTIDRRVVVGGQQMDRAYPQFDTKEVRDALEAQVDMLGHSTKVTAENVAQRTVAVPLPARQSVAIFQVTGHEPLSQEGMRTVTLQATRNLTGRDLLQQLRDDKGVNPFAFQTLKDDMAYIDLERPASSDAKSERGQSETGKAPAKGS